MKKNLLAIFMASLMLVTIFSTINVNARVDTNENVTLPSYYPSGNLDSGTSTDVTDMLLPPTESSSGAPSNYYAVIAGCVRYEDPSSNLPMPTYKLKNLYLGLTSHDNWNPANIRLLLDEDATIGNIRAALNEMARLVGPNDVFLFSWQGHGSKVPESETSGVNDDFESDGYDEVICPYDCDRDDDGVLQNYITDDELDFLFDKINAEGMFLIFESCYSGSLVSDKIFNFDDVDAKGRVVVVSTVDGTLGRGSYIFGFAMTWTIGEVIKKDSMFDNAAEDVNDDGFISAEEIFNCARPKIFVENSIFWAGVWTYFFLAELAYQKAMDTENTLLAALEATALLFVEWAYCQLMVMLMTGGDLMINYPHMVDKYPGAIFNGDELPIIPASEVSDTENPQISPLIQQTVN